MSGDTVGNGTITACDASGNICGASLDSETWHFSCASSSDQLESAVLPDGTESNFGYNADGWLTTNRKLAIAQDPSLGLATQPRSPMPMLPSCVSPMAARAHVCSRRSPAVPRPTDTRPPLTPS